LLSVICHKVGFTHKLKQISLEILQALHRAIDKTGISNRTRFDRLAGWQVKCRDMDISKAGD